ncbi:MAG TPA: alpha/beta fold hydrolase, partial [Algoriphagus sp.]|nr:alpha/beta fold hydrolase [Algoriphagus sp.]
MNKTTLWLIVLLLISSIGAAIFWKSNLSVSRPQEPLKPFSYHTEDVSFQNIQAGITLAGTLTLPRIEGNNPAFILITGSGAQNRDEEVFGHKPFLVLADHLTQHGIAVLRFDDRGFGQSSGDFYSATPLDFASDVESAISYLKTRKEINKNKIGLLGHSEGAIVASLVAIKSEDVSLIVMLSGLGIEGKKALIQQSEMVLKTSGASELDIQNTKDINTGIA